MVINLAEIPKVIGSSRSKGNRGARETAHYLKQLKRRIYNFHAGV